MEDSRVKKPKKEQKKILIIVCVVVVAVLVTLTFATFSLYKEVQDLHNDPSKIVSEQANQLRDKVSKIMQLPDETPTIATVDDADKLKSQAFFQDAQNGDKVLIFSKAQKAVIYRESENKIINSGPIIINTSDADSSQPVVESSESTETDEIIE